MRDIIDLKHHTSLAYSTSITPLGYVHVTTISATEVSLPPVLMCGMPCHTWHGPQHFTPSKLFRFIQYFCHWGSWKFWGQHTHWSKTFI